MVNAQKSSSQGVGTASLDAGAFAGTALTFAFRAKDSSGNVIATSSTSNSETIYVAATSMASVVAVEAEALSHKPKLDKSYIKHYNTIRGEV